MAIESVRLDNLDKEELRTLVRAIMQGIGGRIELTSTLLEQNYDVRITRQANGKRLVQSIRSRKIT